MKPYFYAVHYAALAGYVVAAVHAVLAFVNKRRAAERSSRQSSGPVPEGSVTTGRVPAIASEGTT